MSSSSTSHLRPFSIRVGAILTVLVISFIVLGHYYPASIQSMLKKPLFTLPSATVDWWSVSHFLFFGTLAFLYPNASCELFIVSILWEVVEDGLAPTHSKQLIDCNQTYSNSWLDTFKTVWCEHLARDKDYWYGKWDDVFFNSMGILVGVGLRKAVGGNFGCL